MVVMVAEGEQERWPPPSHQPPATPLTAFFWADSQTPNCLYCILPPPGSWAPTNRSP